MPNGRSEMPDALVSSTTLNAPSCRPDDGGNDRGRPGARRAVLILRDRAVDERIGNERREESQVENVAAQGQQAAVREEERLHGQHRGDHQEGRVRPEQDRQDQAAAQVPARSRAGNREVDHLRGEDERAQHAHHRDEVVPQRHACTFRAQYAISPAVAAHNVPPTAGEISASAMCMVQIHPWNSLPVVVTVSFPCFTPFTAISPSASFLTASARPRTASTSMQL